MSEAKVLDGSRVFDSISYKFALPKFAKLSVAASQTDTALVAAVSGSKIRVLSIALAGPTATSVTFNSKPAGAGTAISALLYSPSNTTAHVECVPYGLFETVVSEGLSVTTGTGGTIGIQITYIEVPS